MILLNFAIILLLWSCLLFNNVETAANSDFDSLTNAKARAMDVLNLIFARYELHDAANMQHFMVTLNAPAMTWEILRLKVAEKILHKGSTFTFVFSGTGVTAGYDNYFHQSYPMVIEKRLSPVFKALGIDLVVRNIGQVHVDCRLSNYCFDALGGEVADVVGWENSFDCGNAKDAHEFIARVAAWKKAVVFYSTSGAYSIDDCPPSQDAIPWVSESWTPESAGIKQVVFDRHRVRGFQSMQQDWHQAGSTAARFTKALKNKYMGVGAHGFSVWAKTTKVCDNAITDTSTTTLSAKSSRRRSLMDASLATPNHLKRKSRDGTSSESKDNSQTLTSRTKKGKEKPPKERYCESTQLKGACHAAGGPHWRVQEAGHYGNAQQRGRKWHPPIGMHLLRAEMLVFTYAHIILDAVYGVEEALAKRGVDLSKSSTVSAAKKSRSVTTIKQELLKEVRVQLATLQTPPPVEPLHCTADECTTMPQCYTDYLPNFNPSHLLSNIIVGTHLGWYNEGVGMNDIGPEFGLLDKKYYYKSEGGKNELHFQLTNVRAGGSVRVYARSKKEQLDEAAFYLDPYINIMRNTSLYKNRAAYVPTAARFPLKTVPINNSNSASVDYVQLTDIPAGDHVLTVMTAPNNPFVISSLSHIVVF